MLNAALPRSLARLFPRAAPIVLLSLGGCAEVQPEQKSLHFAERPELQSGRSTLNQARMAYASGDYNTARSLYTETLRREPNNLEAVLGLGEALLALGEFDAANENLTRVAEESMGGDQQARAQLGLGMVHLKRGEYGRAETLLELSSRADPASWRAWLALGQAYDRQRDFASARRAYARAEGAGPGQAVVLNDAGVSLLAENRPAEALSYFQRALAVNPKLVEARVNIRLAHAKSGNYADAIAGATEEELPAVLNNVGYIALTNGDYDVAESYLNDAVRTSPYHNATALANLQLLQSARNGNDG